MLQNIFHSYAQHAFDLHTLCGWPTLSFGLLIPYFIVIGILQVSVQEPRRYPMQCITAYGLMAADGLIPLAASLVLTHELIFRVYAGVFSLGVVLVAVLLMQKYFEALRQIKADNARPITPRSENPWRAYQGPYYDQTINR